MVYDRLIPCKEFMYLSLNVITHKPAHVSHVSLACMKVIAFARTVPLISSLHKAPTFSTLMSLRRMKGGIRSIYCLPAAFLAARC